MAQQTAIDDLIISLVKFAEIDGVCPDTIIAAIELAENRKEMEKQQIVNAHLTGLVYPLEMDASLQAEQYYNETYKTQAQ